MKTPLNIPCVAALLSLATIPLLYGLEPVSPASEPTSPVFLEGRSGDAYTPRPGAPLTYPLTNWDAGAGTISLRVRLDEPPDQMENAPLVSSGAPPGTWLYLHLHEGRLGFLFQRGEKPFSGAGEFYLNTSVDVSDWEPGVWHHVAIAWAAGGIEESGIRILVDGEPRDERFNVTLNAGTQIDSLTVGSNSASVQAVATQISLDELRIWNLPLTSAEIDEVMTGEIPLEDSLVFAAEFDGQLEGKSGVKWSPDFSDSAALMERLRQ